MKDNFESALEFAMEKHRGQLDKGWTPYIQHLLGVWSRVREESLTTQIVALLHDTVEDTDTTFGEIEIAFGNEVTEAVKLLTHQRGVRYDIYVENILRSGNKHAIRVKIADLDDNSSQFRQQRLPEPSRTYFQRRVQTTYQPAKEKLLIALNAILDAENKNGGKQ